MCIKKISLLLLLALSVACNEFAGAGQADEIVETGLAMRVSGADEADSAWMENAFPADMGELYTTRSGVTFLKIDSIYVLQGDILFTPEQVAELDREPQERGGIYTNPLSFWPNGVLYYEFASDYLYEIETYQAMQQIFGETGVLFEPKTSSTPDYVRFVNIEGTVSFSYYGRKGGMQEIRIAKAYDPWVVGTIMHEICHALGMFHEHCRADRDRYVDILWDNIMPSKEHNFEKYPLLGMSGADIWAFDFNSIMMYGPTTFGKSVADGKRMTTIRRKDGYSYYAQRDSLSMGDVIALRVMYGPPYAKMRVDTTYRRHWDYPGDYMNDRKLDFYVDFYENWYCTIPALLTHPRCLSVHKMEIYDNPSSRPQETNSTVMVPMGVSSYYIGEGSLVVYEIQGSLREYEKVEYSVVNAFK